ncbi:MAG: DsbA family oxidoreductase [Fermentimonas sp.]|nr:DsbA family oxidoreductase [Fermentimonas sp.]
MKIEIWSDVMCPFCYIGKRNFETALEQFGDKNKLEVVWKSFQLDPTLPEVQNGSYTEHLMDSKGMPRKQVEGMLGNVTQMAKNVGLEYDFDKSVMVNSFKSHRLLQLSKTRGLGDATEERLFRAFFTEGKNIADDETLVELGKEVGLNETEIRNALTDEKYSDMVKQDIQEARSIGVSGVPFFVFNRKYAVSGAQPPQAFLQTLEKSFGEWREANPEIKIEVTKGQSCSIDGVCE